MLRRVVVNAGGKRFETYASTLLKFPHTAFAAQFSFAQSPPPHVTSSSSSSLRKQQHSAEPFTAKKNEDEDEVVFLDLDPNVFQWVLNFLRMGDAALPVNDEPLRRCLLKYLQDTELLPFVFPAALPSPASPSAASPEAERDGDETVGAVVELPDVCVVQLCDHMQSDQGSKRHAMTITYGAEGFQLRALTQRIRADLNGQVAASFWQCYQTTERSAFFVSTKVANGTADILTTSIAQQVLQHTESMGYHLTQSYVTLSPDVVHTKVRLLIHNFVFRRVRLPELQMQDVIRMGTTELHEEEEGPHDSEDGAPDDVEASHDASSGGAQRQRNNKKTIMSSSHSCSFRDTEDEESGDAGREKEEGMFVSPNRASKKKTGDDGPEESMWGDAPSVVPKGERATNIWN